MAKTVEEIQRDLDRIFEDIQKVAESVHQTADLPLRQDHHDQRGSPP